MEILSNEIELFVKKIKEYILDQDVEKMDYAINKYEVFISRALKFDIDCSFLEKNIPNNPKDAYDIILSELEMLAINVKGKASNKTINKEKELMNYLKKNNGIESYFGKIDIDYKVPLGRGGNGIVFTGRINNKDVAIKFIKDYDKNKYNRFKAEYFNINFKKDKIPNVVNNIHYDELKINNNIFPYIIMNKYIESLKEYREKIEKIKWKDVEKLFKFLIETLQLVHKENIVHRDIKPENILIDEKENYVLADFGIAHFEKEDFVIYNKTKPKDRLANFQFSAPEQIDSKTKCTPATDIYSMAEIIYWFVFGQIHKGTGIQKLSNIFEEREAIALSKIIDKCLQNSMKDRYQSIEELKNEYGDLCRKHNNKKTYNYFDDMVILRNIMNSLEPKFYENVACIAEKETIKEFFTKLNDATFEKNIEYNSGSGNDTINKIIELDNGNFLINYRQVSVKKIWGSNSSSGYNDLCILELEEVLPYIIDQKECFAVAIINDERIVPKDEMESGYIKIDGKVFETNKLKIQERYINNSDRYIVLGTQFQCSVNYKNDIYVDKLQNEPALNKKIISEFKKCISKNIAYELRMRL